MSCTRQVQPMSECESCQVGNEAALSNLRCVRCHLAFFCCSAVKLLYIVKIIFQIEGRQKDRYMKKLLFLVLSLWSLALLHGYPVHIQSWKPDQDVKAINALNISIDSVNRRSGAIIAYVRDETEHDLLRSHGYDARRIPDASREYYEYLRDTVWASKTLVNEYYDITEYTEFMQNIALDYPNICHLEQFGNSIQGHPLYFMKISDNVSVNEAEPEVKLVASIHGDETVGYIMMLRLIEHLTENYNIDPQITDLLNNTEIWICPLMNPDGYVNGERYNAAGIDLNRNFPMPNGITNPDGNPTAVENIAMMDFSQDHNFAIGINFHGGALVINYPWDYTYTLTPDNQTILDMSLTYSSQNQPMYNSSEFEDGITNGAAWYVITGSMQDWNYGFTNNIELTAEISNIKWPHASTLDGYWEDNRQAILDFIAYAQNGIKGLVTDDMGTALLAFISIIGNNKVIQNDSQLGDYHRIMLPGTYTIKASSPGYIPQTAEVTVPASGYTEHNFVLQTAAYMNISGIIRDSAGFPIPNASIKIDTEPQTLLQSDANGEFSLINIPEGDYKVSAWGSGGVFQKTLALRKHGPEDLLVLILQNPIFADYFENGISNWNPSGTWSIIPDNGNNVLTDSPSGNYGANQNRPISLASPLSLQSISDCQLSFRAKWDLEFGWDYVYVEASSNGSDWDQLDAITGEQEEWTNLNYSLESYSNSDLYLRFRLRSDWSGSGDGIYIDDIIITGINSSHAIYGDVDMDTAISSADLQLILDYSVGGSLDAAQLINADTDLTDGVSTLDAYNILRYMKQSSYMFPAQDPTSPLLPETEISAYMEEGALLISPSDELRSLHLDIPYVIQNADSIESPHYLAMDAANGLMSLVSYYSMADQLMPISLQDPDSSFELPAEINGYTSVLDVQPSDIEDDISSVALLTLSQNYPNPFNPSTLISFTLAKAEPVKLEIFNMKGQLVTQMLNANLPAGSHSVVWNGIDSHGKAVSSGIYFYRLSANGSRLSRKMVLSK